MLAQQDTTFPSLGELLAPRAPSESLTPIADALFPPLPWDFAALPEWKAQTRLLSRFAMRWHSIRRRRDRLLTASLVAIKARSVLLIPAVRKFLDVVVDLIVRDLMEEKQ